MKLYSMGPKERETKERDSGEEDCTMWVLVGGLAGEEITALIGKKNPQWLKGEGKNAACHSLILFSHSFLLSLIIYCFVFLSLIIFSSSCSLFLSQ